MISLVGLLLLSIGPFNLIQSYETDSYVFLTMWGSFGSGDGQFSQPYGIALDSSGNIYVADFINNRIQKFNSTGVFVSKFGSGGSGDGQFGVPVGIAVDSSGNIYVAEFGNNRIQKFNSAGVFVSKFGSLGPGDGQFSGPAGIALDSSGNMYVADTGNNRIQVFSLVSSCMPSPSGEWNVISSCTLMDNLTTITGDVIVNSGVVITIPTGKSLDIDFANHHLLVESGGGVLVQAGGKIF